MSIIKDAKVRKVEEKVWRVETGRQCLDAIRSAQLVPVGFHYVLDLTVEMPEVGAKTITLKIDTPEWAELYLHLDPEDVLKWVEHHIKS